MGFMKDSLSKFVDVDKAQQLRTPSKGKAKVKEIEMRLSWDPADRTYFIGWAVNDQWLVAYDVCVNAPGYEETLSDALQTSYLQISEENSGFLGGPKVKVASQVENEFSSAKDEITSAFRRFGKNYAGVVRWGKVDNLYGVINDINESFGNETINGESATAGYAEAAEECWIELINVARRCAAAHE